MNLQNRWKVRRSNALFLCVVCLEFFQSQRVQATSPLPRFQVKVDADGLHVAENGESVLTYQLKTTDIGGRFPRSNYIHPLFGLSGDCITEDFPEDHLHHRGIFWAWHQVDVGGQRIGDAWLCRDFIWETRARGFELLSDGRVRLQASVWWKSPRLSRPDGSPIPFVQERVEVTVSPREEDFRVVEFRIALKALRPDVFIGGSEDSKGYGGFSPRIRLRPEQEFVSQGRPLSPEKNAIEAGMWVDVSTQKDGVAILTHPSNPGAPEPWILRNSRSMQNAKYPGATTVAVPENRPLILRYQLVVHDGNASAVPLEELQRSFAED